MMHGSSRGSMRSDALRLTATIDPPRSGDPAFETLSSGTPNAPFIASLSTQRSIRDHYHDHSQSQIVISQLKMAEDDPASTSLIPMSDPSRSSGNGQSSRASSRPASRLSRRSPESDGRQSRTSNEYELQDSRTGETENGHVCESTQHLSTITTMPRGMTAS